MAKPLELMSLNIEYSDPTQVIRHEDVSTIRMHGRCLRRNKLIAQLFQLLACALQHVDSPGLSVRDDNIAGVRECHVTESV